MHVQLACAGYTYNTLVEWIGPELGPKLSSIWSFPRNADLWCRCLCFYESLGVTASLAESWCSCWRLAVLQQIACLQKELKDSMSIRALPLLTCTHVAKHWVFP